MMKIGRMMLLVWCGLAISQAFGQSWEVSPELWEKPRSGVAVRTQASLHQCVEAYLAQPAARILIHHADNEESLLQAEELRAWLVALAVEAARIELAVDLKPNRNLNVELISPIPEKFRNGQKDRNDSKN
ncbi:MAG: hypothetical protein LLG15_10600 [Betaproteobacteria bacterium]|nr:hypothetical protein [Betaproteobacteria bacterium]